MSALHVLVVSGGISHEREISIRSGRRVADALGRTGHRVDIVEPDAELFSRIIETKPDVVFPALHGASGEDGSLLDLLEQLGVATVGSSGKAARLAWSKSTAKSVALSAGVQVPAGVVLSRDAFRELSAESVIELISRSLTFPLVIKPEHGGSAQGVTIVREADGLARAFVEAFTYGEVALCEQYIDGTEVAVGVVDEGAGAIALPAIEIAPNDGPYGFEARYNAGETMFYVPARVSQAVHGELARVALQVHTELGLRDLSRIDLIVDREGTPWFLEANVMPGLTETSLFPLALEGAGQSLSAALDALVRKAAQR